MTIRPVLFAALASTLALSAAAAPPPGAGPLETASEVRAAWLGLPGTTNGCASHYDYFPEGGLAIFYCHARSLLSVERLEQLAGFPSTRTPQPGDSPVAFAFRHYEPRFVQWLQRALLPAKVDRRFREKTQPIYDRYVAPLARQLLATRRVMQARRRWTDGEVRWVRDAIVRGELPERWYAERYASLGEEALDRTGWDVNVGPTAVAFWIRREIDGSAPAFTAALEELVTLYDAAWLQRGAGVVGTGRIASALAPPSAAAPPEVLKVSQIWRDRKRLAGRVVHVAGRVLKFDARIMGRNWIHLRDGSGSGATRDNDLTVTLSDGAAVGDSVTIEGTVTVERDFGAGYAYPVILENARIVRRGAEEPDPPAGSDALGGQGGVEEGEEAPRAEGAAPVCGAVREQLSAPPYVFARLSTAGGDTWTAIPARTLRVGESLCVLDPVPMEQFRSSVLGRSFPVVYFGRVEP